MKSDNTANVQDILTLFLNQRLIQIITWCTVLNIRCKQSTANVESASLNEYYEYIL